MMPLIKLEEPSCASNPPAPSPLQTQQAAKSLLYTDTGEALHVNVHRNFGKNSVWASHAWKCGRKQFWYQCSVSIEPLKLETVEYKPADGGKSVLIENLTGQLHVSLSAITDQGENVEIYPSQSKRLAVIPHLMNSDRLVPKMVTYENLRIVDQQSISGRRYQLITKIWVRSKGYFLLVAQQTSHPVEFCEGIFSGSGRQVPSSNTTTSTVRTKKVSGEQSLRVCQQAYRNVWQVRCSCSTSTSEGKRTNCADMDQECQFQLFSPPVERDQQERSSTQQRVSIARRSCRLHKVSNDRVLFD